MKKVLVTDSLFIFDEHVKQLKDAGYEVERLDKPNATENELIRALEGKAGYLMGGIERVTNNVIESTTSLKAMVFVGSDWQDFIPGWQAAKKRGIKIANSPGAVSQAVAEFSMAVALFMQRDLFELGKTGSKTFETAKSFQGSNIGVIGSGRIGGRLIKTVKAFGPSNIRYFSRSANSDVEKFAKRVDLNELLSASDIIFVAVPGSAGQLIDKQAIAKIKKGSLLISISPKEIIDLDALLSRLQKGEVRAAIDWPAPNKEFLKLPLSVWFNTNDHTAYNTAPALKAASDMGTKSLINLLKTGEDEFRVA